MKNKKPMIGVLMTFVSTFFLAAHVNIPSAFPDRVVVNLTEDPSTSMAVTWRTDAAVTVRLYLPD